MEKLKAFWTALRPDLKLHAVSGMLISWTGASILLTIFNLVGGMDNLSWFLVVLICGIFGTALGAAVGWFKEYEYDEEVGGVVDRQDFLYTGRFAIAGAVIWCLVFWIGGWMYDL